MIDFSPLDTLFKAMALLLLIAVPLAIWKVIDLIIWLFNHVEIVP